MLAFRPPLPHEPVSPVALVSFHASLPQGKRLFSLALCRFFCSMGIPLLFSFFLVETAAALFLLAAFFRIFSRVLPPRLAAFPALAFLGIPTVLFSHFCHQPWDTWLMAFLAWALVFILEARFLPLFLLMPLASLNHETAFLVPLLFLAVHFDRLPFLRSSKASLWVVLALLAIHASVMFLATCWAAPRATLAMYPAGDVWHGMVLRHGGEFNWMASLQWLRSIPTNALALLHATAFLPVLPLVFFRVLSPESRRVAEVALFHLVSVFLTGLVFELRCFAATVVILYPVVVVAALRFLRMPLPSPLDALPPPIPALRRASPVLEALAVFALLVSTILFVLFPPLR